MAFAIKTEIKGLEQLTKKLRLLKNPQKAMQAAVRKGGRVILAAARAGCPVDTNPHLTKHGLLKESLGVVVKKGKKETAFALVGPRRGFRQEVGTVRSGPRAGLPIYEDPAKIAHLVEYGHGGPHPAPPHPFLRLAVDTTQVEVATAMAEQMSKDLGVLLG